MRPLALARWRLRRLTAPLRALPDFIVIGAPRSGTTTLYRSLVLHPRVIGARSQETHFFNRTATYRRGLAYYRAFFPLRRTLHRENAITGEGTSVYMFRPNTAERIAANLPGVRLVAVLRDPAERAIASWEAFSARGEEPRPLLEAMTDEIDELGPSSATPPDPPEVAGDEPQPAHVHKGRYADQLARWIALFGADRLLVVFNDELFSSHQQTLDHVFEFLGLESHPVPAPRGAPTLDTAEAEQARETLRSYYDEPDRELATLLGRPLPWR